MLKYRKNYRSFEWEKKKDQTVPEYHRNWESHFRKNSQIICFMLEVGRKWFPRAYLGKIIDDYWKSRT